MIDQQLFNIAVSLCGLLGGWWMKAMWESMKELRIADSGLVAKVNAMEVLIVGDYVKRDELKALGDALFKKLDRIEEKVDKKVDKP